MTLFLFTIYTEQPIEFPENLYSCSVTLIIITEKRISACNLIGHEGSISFKKSDWLSAQNRRYFSIHWATRTTSSSI